MNKPHVSGTEARQAQSADSLPHGLDDGWNWHDQSIDDDEVYLSAVEGFLPREAGVPQQPVAQVLRFCDARNENVRHDGRLDQHKSHGFLAPGVVGFLAGKEVKHGPIPYTSGQSRERYPSTRNVSRHGESFVSACNCEVVASTARREAKAAERVS